MYVLYVAHTHLGVDLLMSLINGAQADLPDTIKQMSVVVSTWMKTVYPLLATAWERNSDGNGNPVIEELAKTSEIPIYQLAGRTLKRDDGSMYPIHHGVHLIVQMVKKHWHFMVQTDYDVFSDVTKVPSMLCALRALEAIDPILVHVSDPKLLNVLYDKTGFVEAITAKRLVGSALADNMIGTNEVRWWLETAHPKSKIPLWIKEEDGSMWHDHGQDEAYTHLNAMVLDVAASHFVPFTSVSYNGFQQLQDFGITQVTPQVAAWMMEIYASLGMDYPNYPLVPNDWVPRSQDPNAPYHQPPPPIPPKENTGKEASKDAKSSSKGTPPQTPPESEDEDEVIPISEGGFSKKRDADYHVQKARMKTFWPIRTYRPLNVMRVVQGKNYRITDTMVEFGHGLRLGPKFAASFKELGFDMGGKKPYCHSGLRTAVNTLLTLALAGFVPLRHVVELGSKPHFTRPLISPATLTAIRSSQWDQYDAIYYRDKLPVTHLDRKSYPSFQEDELIDALVDQYFPDITNADALLLVNDCIYYPGVSEYIQKELTINPGRVVIVGYNAYTDMPGTYVYYDGEGTFNVVRRNGCIHIINKPTGNESNYTHPRFPAPWTGKPLVMCPESDVLLETIYTIQTSDHSAYHVAIARRTHWRWLMYLRQIIPPF